MKHQNRISQLTLELYYRGLATNKERKLVEKALKKDSEVRKRYKALEESDWEIHQIVNQELKRLNVPESPPASPHRKNRKNRKKRAVVGFLLAAAVLCAFIPAYFLLKNSDSKKANVIAEETAPEVNIEVIPNNEIATPSEPSVKTETVEKPRTETPVKKEKPRTEPKKTEIVEKPRPAIGRTEPARPKEPEVRIEPESGVSVATVPEPDTGVRLRGGDQQAKPAVPEEPPNITIPPGITFIFDDMFADKGLTFVIIPSRISSIRKGAFFGNPLVSVTIGANVLIEDNAIPGNFAAVYNAGGKAAGTYTRPDVNSEVWRKK
jgi:hypothetical protein